MRNRHTEERSAGIASTKRPSMPAANISKRPIGWLFASPKSMPKRKEAARTIMEVFAGWGSETKYLARKSASFFACCINISPS
ncbi:Uncharacterised protein [uncultured archaeon]|nr:Uncharacterised protein [uncultured archaeon]